MESIITNGVVVVDLPKGLDKCQPLKTYYTDQREFLPNHGTELVLGSFGAHGHPTSFHHPDIRFIRGYIYDHIKPQLKNVYNQKFSKLELLFDRISKRLVGKTISSETWHRDVCPDKLEGDIVLGGWANLDPVGSEPQIFSCVPGTHMDEPTKTGFAKIPKEDHITLKEKSKIFKIFPGQMILFYQNMIHEIKSGKVKSDSDRLYMGWRLTDSDKPLFDKQKDIDDQGTPRLPSGQIPPMWAKLHWVNHRHMIENFSKKIRKEFLDPKNNLVYRELPSLRDANVKMFKPYTRRERDILFPQYF